MNSDELRAIYLDFFRQRGHVVVRSDTIVPSNDPSVLFTVAGMVQFKPYYTGEVSPPYRRAATAQKCLRTNDLDEVGKTTRHMTFFEMMGNFSFGDYFKREAIAWAWELTANILKFDTERVWISVFEQDDEAHDIWARDIGIPEGRIVRLGAQDNFWGPAGETGACGPCSELLLDRGADIDPSATPDHDPNERFIEFWNLVFPQFDQQPDGSRPPLKNRGIDTGLGLERVAALLQGVDTVFDIDTIVPIIDATEALSSASYAKHRAAFRVIADHIRALSFLIADGVLPGNEGRGYVERRLVRRAARFGRELGLEKPFLHGLVQTVVGLMGRQYPELAEKRPQIERVILTEEQRFQSTLARGMDLLEETFAKMEATGEKVVSGEALFRLHDTYGFPLDLASDIATDRGFRVEREGFDTAMERQRQQARSAWAGSGDEAIAPMYRLLREEVGDTEFVGYETTECPAAIRALIRDGKRVPALEAGAEGEVVLDRTPFYAESGGQAGDTGMLETEEAGAHVWKAAAPAGKMTVHQVRVTKGTLKEGERLSAHVDAEARGATANHHTATHLLQAALRDILGDHIHQAGSLVAPERLRFDFTHFEGIGSDGLMDIERKVNQFIRMDLPVTTQRLPLAEARAAGAMALFGEKYEDTVRVVRVDKISMELCGGTHVVRTGQIGCFKIVSEASVAAGVRRIEAVCGEPCIEVLQARDRQLSGVVQLLNAPAEDVVARVQALIEEGKRLQREVAKWRHAAATGAGTDYMSQVRDVDGIKVLAAELEGQDPVGLRAVIDNLRVKLASGVVILGSVAEGKVSLCAAVTKDLTGRIKAGDIVKRLAPIVGGGGGGRPDLAEAGGKLPDRLPEAIAQAPEIVKALLDNK